MITTITITLFIIILIYHYNISLSLNKLKEYKKYKEQIEENKLAKEEGLRFLESHIDLEDLKYFEFFKKNCDFIHVIKISNKMYQYHFYYKGYNETIIVLYTEVLLMFNGIKVNDFMDIVKKKYNRDHRINIIQNLLKAS